MEMNALDLRRGNLVRYEGHICEVIFWNILKNDRRQFVQMKVKNLKTGRIAELKEHGDTKFEALDNQKVEISHSYRDGSDEVFYTPEGEEVRCNKEAAEDALKWPCDLYNGLVVDGVLVSVTPPQTVVIGVTDTAPPDAQRRFGPEGRRARERDEGARRPARRRRRQGAHRPRNARVQGTHRGLIPAVDAPPRLAAAARVGTQARSAICRTSSKYVPSSSEFACRRRARSKSSDFSSPAFASPRLTRPTSSTNDAR